MLKPKKKGKQHVNSKKVLVDGIEFGSGLEAFMYKELKAAGIPHTYADRKYLLIDAFKYPVDCIEKTSSKGSEFKDRRTILKMQYTPDFIDPNEEWIIETKGRANESFPLRWKIFKSLVRHWENPPMLFKPTNQADCKQVVQFLIDKGYGRKTAGEN